MGVLQSTSSRRLNTGASRQLDGASQGGPPPLTGAAGTSVRAVAAVSASASVTATRWPRPAAGRPAVEIAHLRKTYGSLVAVDDVSLSVAEGEIFGILGPNGAGKTTTVECAIGLRSYRELGILRRLSTTPEPASWVLAAQLVVQVCLMMTAVLILLVVSVAFFGASTPKSPDGLVVALALAIAALFAIGLAIAAAAKTSGAARGLMAAAFYPMMFFSGLYYPIQLMPGVFQGISHASPLGAAVVAIQDSMLGQFPPAEPLLVMLAYALVFGYLAKALLQMGVAP